MNKHWDRIRGHLAARAQRLRTRSTAVDIVAACVERYRANRLGRSAALLAHYGFLSVFPLLVCFTTILGFVLQGDTGLQVRIVDSALAHLPVVGPQLAADAGSLRGNGLVLAVSLGVALWAGMRAFVVAQGSIDDIDHVPLAERAGLVRGRLKALATVGVIGASQVVTALAAALLSASPLGWPTQVAILGMTVAVDVALVGLAFHLLSSRRRRTRSLLPGAVIAGVSFAALQLVGSLVVGRAVTRATPVYGTFATVIGLLSWLGTHAAVALVGFQLVVVLEERRQAVTPGESL